MALVETESPPGTAAITQTADGHRMRPVSPCGPPRLAMWRFGCPMIRIDAGGTAGAQSAAARAHAECRPRKSPRSRVFLNSRPFLTTEVLGSNLRNLLEINSRGFPEAKVCRCAPSGPAFGRGACGAATPQPVRRPRSGRRSQRARRTRPVALSDHEQSAAGIAVNCGQWLKSQFQLV